ncbi:hypothetical protein BH23PLA1_BH23PLA1_01720 [soil metagenome]
MNTLLDLRDLSLIASAVILGTIGAYLLLPHRLGRLRTSRLYAVGAVLTALALLPLLRYLVPPGPPGFQVSDIFFYAFSFFALAGAVLMITARDPIHSALWFAVVVLSSSGLFLLAGAQFLAAGTVIVYAGAIIVTFLFVIMLAQSQGQAVYDRMARRPLAAALTSFLLFGGLLFALLSTRASEAQRPGADPIDVRLRRGSEILANQAVRAGVGRAVSETAVLPPVGPDGSSPHVAGLGGTLFTDHLVTIEVIGVLLFVALIGAVAIATPKTPPRRDSGPPPIGRG